MSSARKRAAIQKANSEADFQRQRAMRAEHHANVMQGFAEVAARKSDALQAQLDALMLEFCPEEMTEAQKANWARHQRPASEETQENVATALMGSNVIVKGRCFWRPLQRGVGRLVHVRGNIFTRYGLRSG